MTLASKSTVTTERYVLKADEIQELIRQGFLHETFLGGTPGTGQTVDYDFDLGYSPAVTIVVTTRHAD